MWIRKRRLPHYSPRLSTSVLTDPPPLYPLTGSESTPSPTSTNPKSIRQTWITPPPHFTSFLFSLKELLYFFLTWLHVAFNFQFSVSHPANNRMEDKRLGNGLLCSTCFKLQWLSSISPPTPLPHTHSLLFLFLPFPIFLTLHFKNTSLGLWWDEKAQDKEAFIRTIQT